MDMEKFYVTTSIAYVNAPPHIGFALESLQADVLARYHRQRGADSFFLTGTDEHGAKIAKVAEASGKNPKQVVDENAVKFKELKSALNLSWDNFIRTSDQAMHWPIAQEIWRRLEKSGDLYRRSYEGLYCVGHEAFVTQKDLVDGKCADHQKEPELIKEENWFFKLSKYTKDIESKIKTDELKIIPESRKNEILALLGEGLEDVSFSRPSKDLSWGVPVPGDSTQTMYVWADALSNYISGYAADSAGRGGMKKWEEHPADVHVIGKDILRFHAAIWPGMLISAGLPLPKSLFVHGHILSGGQKMSKSLGNVVDPFELVKKYGADSVRYYLLREIPSLGDGDFSYEKFEERYNGDLANGIGNFAARVLTLGSQLGELKSQPIEQSVGEEIERVKEEFSRKIADFRLHESLEALWALVHFGDRYVNAKKPWDKAVTEADKRQAIHNALVILDNISALLAPFLPETSEKITNAIKFENGSVKIEKITNLFPRLEK
jgi:methionyl-tRNA synthetase